MNRLTDGFGMGKVITAGAALQMFGCKSASSNLALKSALSLITDSLAAYIDAVCIAPPPFAVLPCVYVFVGCGVALQDAGANAWVAGLPNTHKKLVG